MVLTRPPSPARSHNNIHNDPRFGVTPEQYLTSLIWTTLRKCLDVGESSTSRMHRFEMQGIVYALLKRWSWIFCGDEHYYLSLNSAIHSEVSADDIDTICRLLKAGYAPLQPASQTISVAMRIGMIIWLVITIQDQLGGSDWEKWDVQGRAFPIWVDTFYEVMRDQQRPFEAIITNDDAMEAFRSAMDGHQHDYEANPDIGAWVTMRAALFPKLEGDELACWHYNDEDDCSLCDERLQEKIGSETDRVEIPPLYLVVVWDHMVQAQHRRDGCPGPVDFEGTMAFVAVQQPELFLPSVMEPVQELLARRYPKKARRIFCLHSRLSKRDPLVKSVSRNTYDQADFEYPCWTRVEVMINSLLKKVFFPHPAELTTWFDTIQLLDHQYQSRAHWRRTASLITASNLGMPVLGHPLPPLNLSFLPQSVQRAVTRFCDATERDEHTCTSSPRTGSQGTGKTWRQLDVEYRRRYAAAYALLYSTDRIPSLNDHPWRSCDACRNIRKLYKCVDAISAGKILLKPKKMAKVVHFIRQIAAEGSEIPGDSWESSEESDPGGSSDNEHLRDETHDNEVLIEPATHSRSEDSNDRLSLANSSGNQEVFGAETRGNYIPVDNDMNTLAGSTSTGSGSTWAAVHDHLVTGTGSESLAPAASLHEHWIHFVRDVIPDSVIVPLKEAVTLDAALSLGEHPNPSIETFVGTQQTFESMFTSKSAGPRLKPNTGQKASKDAQSKELRDFFLALFEKYELPVGTTNMGEPQLPWKNMNNILERHGLEIVGWPNGVPAPGSYGKVDKGISGFNAEHIRALYEAMAARRIDFKPLAGTSQPLRSVRRVRRRGDDSEGEDKVGTQWAKKGKWIEKKKPKDFLAMQSVMKF